MAVIASLPRLKPLTSGVSAYVEQALKQKNGRPVLDLVINGRTVDHVEISEIEFHLGCLHLPALSGTNHIFPIHQITRFAQDGSFAFGGSFEGRSLIVELR